MSRFNLTQKSFIYFEKPDKWDTITTLLFFWLTVYFYLSDFPFDKDLLFFYAFGSHLFIYIFNYKSLRKFNIWLIWFVFSLIHLHLYSLYYQLPEYQMYRGFAGNGLKYTWLLLVLFQLLRYLSIKFQHQELVSLSKSQTDIWENRRITKVDAACFFTYLIIAFTLDVFLS